MKKYLVGIIFSLPVQLTLLHFRRHQVLLFFWVLLFATISGHFLQPYGADSLYLSPEYLGKVNALSMAVVGFAVGIFVMSWNITTFILYTRHIRFLVTTEQPFLKYCINNAPIPIIFLIFYFVFAAEYSATRELLSTGEIILMMLGFLGGFALCILISLAYFFSADKTIYNQIGNVILSANKAYEAAIKHKPLPGAKGAMRVDWFLTATLKLRKPRNTEHYSKEFLDSVFKRHHFAAAVAIILAFAFILITGFFSDSNFFQVPAGASITILFSILIALIGAISIFFSDWGMLLLLLIYLSLNWMYKNYIIDPRNKAYGLNYSFNEHRPPYSADTITALATPENTEADKKEFLQMLNNWKQKQNSDTPVIFILNVSGGGLRSAAFVMNVLQHLDSSTQGQFMKHTVLISGASGGILGASYFRELYLRKSNGANIDINSHKYLNNISEDLLNPLFSTMVSRDLMGPVQKFTYNGYEYRKDRGYAFEQKLNQNTKNVLNKKIGAYRQPEMSAQIPAMIFSPASTRDGRQMIIATHPSRFLMQPASDSFNNDARICDAIDFNSFFKQLGSDSLSFLSALRMNATFPYVLPNVWLPTSPSTDFMDAGMRDNTGVQISLRFISTFKTWLQQNTAKVVLVQIQDRIPGDWDRPYTVNNIFSFITKPALLLQNNWFKLQDYYFSDALNYFSHYFGSQFQTVTFHYIPSEKNNYASISFHLTASEKKDVENSLSNQLNTSALNNIEELLK